MTVKKKQKSGGLASIISRQKLQTQLQEVDYNIIPKTTTNYNVVVTFNDKDQLQIEYKDDKNKIDTIKIDEIINCANIESHTNLNNTLIFYIQKLTINEAVAITFENEQDYKRIYFTYKYFKMRNRLANNTNVRKNIKKNDQFDLKAIDNEGVTHLSVQKVSKFDQPLSLIGIDQPKVYKSKVKPFNIDINGIFKVDNSSKELVAFRDKSKVKNSTISIGSYWNPAKLSPNGYESDREDWRRIRSQFSTTAYDSLSRPVKKALTLRKPHQTEHHQFYKPSTILPIPNHLTFQRNYYPLNGFASLQNLDRIKETKKNGHFTSKINGLTNKVLGNKKISDGSTLKPVIKKTVDGRQCSVEPHKKVTFSAFATVQVV